MHATYQWCLGLVEFSFPSLAKFIHGICRPGSGSNGWFPTPDAELRRGTSRRSQQTSARAIDLDLLKANNSTLS